MNTSNGDFYEPNTRPLSRPPLPSAASHPAPRHYHGASEESYEVILSSGADLVCLSNQRWEGPSPRQQQLMSRFSKQRRVFFIERAHEGGVQRDRLQVLNHGAVTVLTPMLASGGKTGHANHRIRLLLNDAMRTFGINDYVLWYYDPSAMGFTRHLFPKLVVWDCEEAPVGEVAQDARDAETNLLAWADLVFTNGHGLCEAKRRVHAHVTNLPSAIDAAHFLKARRMQSDPCDQEAIPRPRIGCHLAMDERCDLDLITESARLRPAWQWIMVGAVQPDMAGRLPQATNIHYLGSKDLSQLPYYMAGWDAAMVPLLTNESTSFSNPMEVQESLAAGCPVVATSVPDVRHVYGEEGLVLIADSAREFISALERAMVENGKLWRAAVDEHLQENSWDHTYDRMTALVEAAVAGKQSRRAPSVPVIEA